MSINPGTLTRASLEGLYMELEKPLFNVVFRYLWNREDAQDIVQEAFIRLWKMGDRVEMGTVKPLVYRICLNLASSSLRRKRILHFFSLDRVGEEPVTNDKDCLEQKEEIFILRKVMEKLPVRFREIVLLTEFSDMSYMEIGKVLSIPAGTVGSRRNRAIEIMRHNFVKIYGNEL